MTGKSVAVATGLVIAVCAGVFYYNRSVASTAMPAPKSFASGGQIDGIWVGTLTLPNHEKIRLVFSVRRELDQSLSATLESPERRMQGITVDHPSASGDYVTFPVKTLEASYEGKRVANDRIEGKWHQDKGRFPVTLIRTDRAPAIPTPVPRREVAVDPRVLDDYIGQYSIEPKVSLTITRERDSLAAQVTGQPRVIVYAEAPDKFFYKEVDAQITFKRNANGQVDRLKLHQFNQDIPAKRFR